MKPLAIIFAALVIAAGFGVSAAERTSRLVAPGADGRLVYKADARGNRIADFSHAGYGGGGVALPMVAVKARLAPGDGDDGARIQAAIDRVAALAPDANGIRGAVQLGQGQFEVAGQIHISASGIVLRGAGQGEGGTRLRATGTGKRRLIVVKPRGRMGGKTRRKREVPGTRRAILDAYVPVGAISLRVAGAGDFTVGDAIVVIRPSTAKWIRAIGMDRIPERRDGRRIKQWKPGKYDIHYNRVIVAVGGERIRLDAPLFHAIDRDYGGGFVAKYDTNGLLSQIGIEALSGVSDSDGSGDDEDHARSLIFMDFVHNGWVRNVSATGFVYSAVELGYSNKWITVQDSQFLDPVSRISGGRRYGFKLQGQLNLGQRLFARNGRHDFVVGRQYSSGVVFLDSRSVGAHSITEPHHRYSTGILYDNISMEKTNTDLAIALWNRTNKGSGHGWAAANSVVWNATADGGIAVEKPPLAQNYCIGCRSDTMSAGLGGRKRNLSALFAPKDAHWEHWNTGPVTPRSLYRAQLRDRLGAQA
ncbi:MAG: hypothetical protein V3T02_08320, partial [Alphaproteobacteria bacterium]